MLILAAVLLCATAEAVRTIIDLNAISWLMPLSHWNLQGAESPSALPVADSKYCWV